MLENEWAKYVDVLFCNKNSCLLNHRKINEVINFDAQKLSKYSELIAEHKYRIFKQSLAISTTISSKLAFSTHHCMGNLYLQLLNAIHILLIH